MKLQRNAAAVIALGAAVAISTPVEAKRNKGNDTVIAKLRSDMVDLKRKVSELQRVKVDPPGSVMLAAIAAFPPEGFGRLTVPPVSADIPTPFENERPRPRTLTTYRDHLPGVSMKGAPEPLQAWMRKVAASCAGFKAISVCRPGARVAGSGRVSLHSTCRAVDFQVASPACAWGVLNKKGDRFPGGLSNDYARVAHFHASWAQGSGEWTRRFAHGGGRSAKRHYAKRGKFRRYARRHHRRAAVETMQFSAASRALEQRGIASHYSAPQSVACGGRLDAGALTAAHRTLPCGTQVTVTNLRNGRTVVVVVRDRGPFIRGRIIDVTTAAARKLGFSGLTPVSVKEVRS